MSLQPRAPLRVPFFYGLVVLTLSFLTTLVAAGIRSSPQVLIYPLETEFGWSRAAIASAVSFLASEAAGYLTGATLDVNGRCFMR